MNKILVFTDGAAKGNPGPGGWGAVLLFGDKVKEIGAAKENTTNNEMELMAAVEALRDTKVGSNIELYSDSKYVVEGASGWVYGWERNGWKTKSKTEVQHRKIWEELLKLSKEREVVWHKVPGHVNLTGNDCADKIASDFGDKRKVELYEGSFEEYGHDITDTSYDKEEEEKRREARRRQSAKAYSYVSLVDGKVKTHKTWQECLGRVDGRSGARYRKALNEEEEKEIIADFNHLV